jgi:predicted small lipoprotein YifL
MFAAIREPAVTAFSPLRLAVIGALAMSFALTACGRKGALDLPPRSAAQPASQPQQQAAAEPTEDEDGNMVLPRGQKKGFLLDWLLN